jgi:secreted PhoX family phosphatase
MQKFKVSLLLSSLLLALPVYAQSVVTSVEFTPTPAPVSAEERSRFYTRSSAIVTYRDGAKKVFPMAYQTLYRSGDKFANNAAGLIVDKAGRPILRSAANAEGEIAQGPFYSFSPDANSLLGIQNGKDSASLITHFEYSTDAPNVDSAKPPVSLYGQLPAAIYQARILQDKKTGLLHVTALNNVDASASDGIWTPCGASQTPWGTHLGGEEYEPNAKEFETVPFEAMNLYTATPGKTAQAGGSNPYAYGYKFEVSVADSGTSTDKQALVKHYAMGRLANELGDVMPDQRTVYMGDDGRDTVMFMFVADQAGKLSAGTLYAAIWMQVFAANGGQAGLRWIPLGHASDDEVHQLVQSGLRFSDIFEVVSVLEVKANPEKYSDFKAVYAYPGTGKEVAHLEYLKLKAGQEKAAAFLESRRYAAMLGATSEFTKMEGVTHNTRDKRLYIAMSYIEKGMVDKLNEDRAQDDINLEGDPKDLVCGAVYEATLGGGEHDLQGNKIDSLWVASSIQALVTGGKKPFGQTYGELDKCDTDRIANPDNLKYSESMRTLFISEDSGNHLNNFVWAYNVDRKQSTRIFSAPIGGENTGLQVVEDWNGYAYLMSNIQHPAAVEDLKQYPDAIKNGLGSKISQKGIVGYISGLPAVSNSVNKLKRSH